MSTLVTVEQQEYHTLVTMDDGKANALSFDTFDALNAALDQASGDKPVVIAGREGKFSAGFDLSIMGRLNEDTQRLLREGADMAIRLLTHETPVVLAVTGHALAMGALMCLSADYRIGTRGAYKIGLNEVAIGMTLPWFGIELARARIVSTQLNTAVGFAQIYDTDGAVSVGYLDEAVEAEGLHARVGELTQALGALDMKAHRETKARVREPLMERMQEALRRDFGAA